MTRSFTPRVLALFPSAASIAFATLTIPAQQPVAPAPAATKPIGFDVVTIKPHELRQNGWMMRPILDGYSGQNISLYQLVQEAYGDTSRKRDPKLIAGGPSWINEDKFDLDAKFDPAEIPDFKNLTYRQRADMLQPVLADRFHLKVHFETKDFPVYNLVVAKDGPKFQQTKPEDIRNGPTGTPDCLSGLNPRSLIYTAVGCRTADLEGLLHSATGRTVFDKTGLTARYDFELRWSSDDTPANSPAATFPSIFTAVQEQLGLKLEPSTAPLSVLVIDSAEHPSAN